MVIFKKIYNIIFPILCLFIIFKFPIQSINGAKSGLLLWYSTIIPTLLPFIIISKIIVNSDSIKIFSYPFKILKKKFPTFNENIPFAIIMGIMCGYPMEAKLLNDMNKNNLIDNKNAQILLCLFNNASPMFIFGYVYGVYLKNILSISTIILLIYIPIVIYGVFLFVASHIFKNNKISATSIDNINNQAKEISINDIFMDAVNTIVMIGIYMMLFSIASNILIKITDSNIICSACSSILEITLGIDTIWNLDILLNIKTALILAITAFGGISSIAQTKCVLSNTELSINRYIISKIILSCMTYISTIIYLNLFV